jgi:Gpi18-like mannosyltransferase
MTNRFLILSVLIWQLIIITCTIISVRYLPLRDKFFGGLELASPSDPNPFLRNPALYSRANFDGIHYINIARGTSVGVSQSAFFPLYTKLIAVLGPLFKNHNLAGVVISLMSFVIGSFMFKKLLALDYAPVYSRWIYLALLFFPTSFYFGFVYTEGLYFLLSISTFYFARTRHWWLAGLTGALASYTRITGVILFPALIIELFSQSHYSFKQVKSQLKNLIPVFLILLGLMLFMWQLNQSVHDPLAFLHVQSTFAQGRSDKLIILPQVFWRYLKIVVTFNRSDPLFYTILFELFTSIVFLVLSIISFARHRLSYSFFNFTCFILPTLTGTFTSMPRYVLTCFPAFFIIGHFLSKSKPFYRYTYFGFSFLLGLIFLSLFVRGFWVS